MSENEQNRHANAQLQRELAELEDPRVKYQTMLDRWWHERRTIEVEAERIRQQLNPYGLKIWD
jgi:hypothetical protein